jgi:hypothetical protein
MNEGDHFMGHRRVWLIVLTILAFGGIATVLAQSNIVAVLDEHFDDGDYTNNPTWSDGGAGWTSQAQIVNGELVINGSLHDASGRYLGNLAHVTSTVETSGYLEMSFRGMLLSAGNPQEGRGVQLTIGGLYGDYSLQINNGFVGGWPTNAIYFQYGSGGYRYVLIATPYAPERDRWYDVRAVRQGGIWTLFIDGALVGTSGDPLQLNSFDQFIIASTGSVRGDDFVVRIEPTTPPNTPPDCSGAIQVTIPYGRQITG